MTIKAVLFDMGNTLIEFETRPLQELQAVAQSAVHERLNDHVGNAVPSLDDFRSVFLHAWNRVEKYHLPQIGQPTLAEALQIVLGELQFPVSPALIDELELVHYEAVRVQIHPYPEVEEVLGECRDRGLHLALISNTIWPSHLHLDDLIDFNLDKFFHRIIFSRDFGLMKPHPAIFLEALSGSGIMPEEAVVVGDRVNADIQGARNTGCKAVLKLHPYSCPGSSGSVHPDAEICSLRELLPLLDRL